MDITIYLPDEIGKRAKEAELPLSGMLRAAVQDLLARREMREEATKESDEVLLDLKNDDDKMFTGRFTGRCVCRVEDWEYYLTSDGRLIAYDSADLEYHEADASDRLDVDCLWNDGHPPEAIAKVSGLLGFSYTVDI